MQKRIIFCLFYVYIFCIRRADSFILGLQLCQPSLYHSWKQDFLPVSRLTTLKLQLVTNKTLT